ncbi:hypothetical protein K437DRAFT_52187 [Tilletiaria anomala UBC 951]|uniref:Uncharacterized protein n=1 Tax=Tilletiaria anomala (strain ATCC 24038 / CBS 436.72 / UBC 951) TaxID=1037660 RepID=A0A066WLE2_TILAU|nr:uncharacterized protein K437DRAFT_52187 [Tilletiaria anomala UBC 951]KDN51455.1 hypothetical protein K437DRAFT_52187 [Tilletiaria anomala UBC 951]
MLSVRLLWRIRTSPVRAFAFGISRLLRMVRGKGRPKFEDYIAAAAQGTHPSTLKLSDNSPKPYMICGRSSVRDHIGSAIGMRSSTAVMCAGNRKGSRPRFSSLRARKALSISWRKCSDKRPNIECDYL